MSDQAELERVSELLPRLAMAVIFQCMRSPSGIAIDKPHLRHAWLMAKSVERIADSHGYWPQESAQSLLDLQQAMLEALRLLHGKERGVPQDLDYVDREGGEWALQRDPDEGDADYAARKLLFEGSDRELKRQIARAVIYATEAAGAWNQPAFLRSIGMPEDWIVRSFEDADSVPLDEFMRVYAAAAAKAGWQSMAEIVKEVTARQRFKEWP
jgi:hypothetical protein